MQTRHLAAGLIEVLHLAGDGECDILLQRRDLRLQRRRLGISLRDIKDELDLLLGNALSLEKLLDDSVQFLLGLAGWLLLILDCKELGVGNARLVGEPADVHERLSDGRIGSQSLGRQGGGAIADVAAPVDRLVKPRLLEDEFFSSLDLADLRGNLIQTLNRRDCPLDLTANGIVVALQSLVLKRARSRPLPLNGGVDHLYALLGRL